MGREEFTITVPDPPTPEQIEVLWEAGGSNALAKFVNILIDRCLEDSMLVIRGGAVVPANEAEVLRFADESDIIGLSLMTEVS